MQLLGFSGLPAANRRVCRRNSASPASKPQRRLISFSAANATGARFEEPLGTSYSKVKMSIEFRTSNQDDGSFRYLFSQRITSRFYLASSQGVLAIGNGVSFSTLSNIVIADGQWHTIELEFDASVPRFYCRLDGVLIYDQPTAYTGLLSGFRVGRRTGDRDYFVGKLANFKVWLEDELVGHYSFDNRLVTTTEPNLIAGPNAISDMILENFTEADAEVFELDTTVSPNTWTDVATRTKVYQVAGT